MESESPLLASMYTSCTVSRVFNAKRIFLKQLFIVKDDVFQSVTQAYSD